TAKEYVRRTQERVILAPVIERLVAACGNPLAAQHRLLDLLSQFRELPLAEQGYGPGNVVNLMRLLRGDLRKIDLSGLLIRQAYLEEVEAQDASLAGAYLSEVVLADAFNFPICVSLSDDGTFLATGTAAGEMWLWQVADRTPLLAVQAHTAP